MFDAGSLDEDLDLRAGWELPPRLSAGRGDCLFVFGSCFHRRQRVEEILLRVDGREVRPDAQRMPRLDVYRSAPDRDSYRSGFWALVPIRPGAPHAIELLVEARLADGTRSLARVAEIDVEEADPADAADGGDPGPATTAICMASFDPDIELFRRQLASIRSQTRSDWVCLISDDCTPPARFAEMEAALEGDPRFVISRSPRHLGFYRNFERALRMAPADVRWVALVDQDDEWHPDKLDTLQAAIGDAKLVYSDARIVEPGGAVIAGTYWSARRNNHTNLASLLVANTVTGAASLMRRDLLEFALPFPHPPGTQYHDHWLALVALTLGEIAYVDRPLYDYIQHEGAALGHRGANVVPTLRVRSDWGRSHGLPLWRRLVLGWRSSYFFNYLRLKLLAVVLLERCGALAGRRKRRALKLLASSEHAPLAFGWLALRPARRLAGRSESLGAEGLLACGILWRHMVGLLAAGREKPPRWASFDAGLPAEGTESVGTNPPDPGRSTPKCP